HDEKGAKQDIDDNDVDEDNIPLSPGIEVLRRSNVDDEDNVPLSLKYHTTPQDLIPVDINVEVVGVSSAPMNVEVEDNSVLIVGDDGEVYGIDDVTALVDSVIEEQLTKFLRKK
ncbi:hypothetical protein Dimus_018249, partial [Dionaea muscipula]